MPLGFMIPFCFFRLLNDKREQAREDLKGLEETVVRQHVSQLASVPKTQLICDELNLCILKLVLCPSFSHTILDKIFRQIPYI